MEKIKILSKFDPNNSGSRQMIDEDFINSERDDLVGKTIINEELRDLPGNTREQKRFLDADLTGNEGGRQSGFQRKNQEIDREELFFDKSDQSQLHRSDEKSIFSQSPSREAQDVGLSRQSFQE